MKLKLILPALALVLTGVIAGAVLTDSAAAQDSDADAKTEDTRPMPSWLTDEQKSVLEEVRAERDAHRAEAEAMHENIDREVVKTDNGIQINLTSDDADTVQWMHDRFDENGGEFGPMGGGKGPGHGRGMRGMF